MLHTTKLYSTVWFQFGWSWWSLKVTGKVELCCKVTWSNSNVHDGWLCKGDDCEEALYDEERGLFEHFSSCAKYIFNIIMCLDTSEPICFKLNVINTTKFYSLIPVWMTLMFTQGHRIMGKLELVQSFCCKVAWRNSNVHDGWLCKRDVWKVL